MRKAPKEKDSISENGIKERRTVFLRNSNAKRKKKKKTTERFHIKVG